MKRLTTLPILLALAAVLAIAACGKTGGGTGAASTGVGLTDTGYGFGDPKAKVTVIEFASLTCPHCAKWEAEVWPAFKAKYIDTGKVHYEFREFLIHPQQDAAGGLLTRCVSPDKYFPTVQALLRSQEAVFTNARDGMLRVALAQGMTEQQFDACLSNTKALDAIGQRQQKAMDQYKIEFTPTFIINGKAVDGEVTLDKLSSIIDPLLAKS